MIEWTCGNRCIKLLKGNIIDLDVDVLVNAANKSLILGGGVAGAIRASGGPSIQDECDNLGPIGSGEAVLTSAGDLKARYVIHAVGPVYGEGGEDFKLERAVYNSLEIASRENLKSIAFPAISTGIYRFPLKRCAEIMLKTAGNYIEKHNLPETIIFCLYDDRAFDVFRGTLKELTAFRPA